MWKSAAMGVPVTCWVDVREFRPLVAVGEVDRALHAISPGGWVGVVVGHDATLDELRYWSQSTGQEMVSERMADAYYCAVQRRQPF